MVEITGDIVRKRGEPKAIALEAAKTRAASTAAAGIADLVVPSVLNHDADTGILDTARVKAFRSIYDLASRRDPRTAGLCRRVGSVLARVHATLGVDSSDGRYLPDGLVGEADDDVCLHGDFNGSNVGYDPALDRIVVIDWASAPAIGGFVSRGSRYFDVMWFTLFFFRFRPLRAVRGWAPETWADEFLAGYSERAHTFRLSRFVAYVRSASAFLDSERAVEVSRQGQGPRAIAFKYWRARCWRRWANWQGGLDASEVLS